MSQPETPSHTPPRRRQIPSSPSSCFRPSLPSSPASAPSLRSGLSTSCAIASGTQRQSSCHLSSPSSPPELSGPASGRRLAGKVSSRPLRSQLSATGQKLLERKSLSWLPGMLHPCLAVPSDPIIARNAADRAGYRMSLLSSQNLQATRHPEAMPPPHRQLRSILGDVLGL